MSQTSEIEWTDATWNPVRGCVKVSQGCAHCYAETFAERFRGVAGHPYEQGFDLRVVPEKLDEPLRWKKPRRVFVNSMSDLFQDGVPVEYIGKVFDVMAQARRHTFQVLTKRADRMREIVQTFAARHTAPDGSGWPLPNVWLGVSVENQHFADERIPLLLQTPAAVRFISAEPLLGPVLLDNGDTSWLTCTPHVQKREGADCCMHRIEHGHGHFRGIDWVIVGGESGHGARPFDVGWARSVVKQCQSAGVAVFVKQLGANVLDRNDAGFEGDTPRSWPMDTDVIDNPHGYREEYQGASVRVRLHKKGGEMPEWPEDLQIREFPEGSVRHG